MRCWNTKCRRVIALPERQVPEGELYSQTHTVEAACYSCGARYQITTAVMPDRRRVPRTDPRTQEEKEHAQLWKGEGD